MWFIFPQIDGLGTSATTKFYSIKSEAEARAYLALPVLGPRLIACADAVLGLIGKSVSEIFDPPDDQKFWSCMTLFAWVAEDDSVFARVLERYFGGKKDENTLHLWKGHR